MNDSSRQSDRASESGIDPVRTPRQLAAALRAGECPSDREFDLHLPAALRAVSEDYWTPLQVARRACRWFAEERVRSVVDIGSGVGKFCVAAAILDERIRFWGVEQRAHLVEAARALAGSFGVEAGVTFVQGGLSDAARLPADAYYLYNPFAENLVDPRHALDREAELSRERHERDLRAAEALLAAVRSGTYVVTYNGFGGRFPADYELLRRDDTLPYELMLWRKRPRAEPPEP